MHRNYRVWCDERGSTIDNALELNRWSHKDAADEWASIQHIHQTIYAITEVGSTTTVHVIDENDKMKTFEVTGFLRYGSVYYRVKESLKNYLVWWVESKKNARNIKAQSHEDAARKWAEDELWILDEGADVQVLRCDNFLKTMHVTAKQSIVYKSRVMRTMHNV